MRSCRFQIRFGPAHTMLLSSQTNLLKIKILILNHLLIVHTLTDIMSGRGLRARAPVSYNDKANSMEPAWLKGITSTKTNGISNGKQKKPSSASELDEKENDAGKALKSLKNQKPANSSKPPKGNKSKAKMDTEKHAEKLNDSQNDVSVGAKGQRKRKASTAQPAASRGRNAGVTVVPIGDLCFCFLKSLFKKVFRPEPVTDLSCFGARECSRPCKGSGNHPACTRSPQANRNLQARTPTSPFPVPPGPSPKGNPWTRRCSAQGSRNLQSL